MGNEIASMVGGVVVGIMIGLLIAINLTESDLGKGGIMKFNEKYYKVERISEHEYLNGE